jgi:hypothetical protein
MHTSAISFVNWNSRQAASWSTASADPPPDDGPGGPLIPGDTGYGSHAALALQTMLDAQKRGACLNCGQEHRTWQCPEIARALHAPEPWKDVALGRELCRMRWHNFNGFVTLLKTARDHGHLMTYAASYQAFVRDHSPDSTMTISQVMQAWARIMSGEPQRQAA